MRNNRLCNRAESAAGWEVMLFFSLYVVSPTYFALELSQKLPLVTFSRFLLVLMGGMVLLRRRKALFGNRYLVWQNWNFSVTNIKVLRIGLFGYFLLLLVSNLALLSEDFAGAVKAIFSLMTEELFLVWLLALILDTRKKILTVLKAMVYVSGITGTIVAVGCVLECNPFFLLNTVKRDMLMVTELRLGMLRASAGFGHPVFYGAFCAVILPLHMYFLEQCEKQWKKILLSGNMAMCIVGLILANARGAIFSFGCLVIFSGVTNIIRHEFKLFCRRYIPVAITVIIVLIIISMLSPVGIKFLWGYVYSIIRIVFPDIAAASGQLGVEYGSNSAGVLSRTAQLSGMIYTLKNKPLFGFGVNAHGKKLIPYEHRPGDIWPVATVDVGIVAIICQYGIVGFLGYSLLFGSVLSTAFKFHKDRLMSALGMSVVIYLLSLLTIASLDKMLWVIVASIVCLSNILHKEAVQ